MRRMKFHFPITSTIALLMILIGGSPGLIAEQGGSVPTRDEIDEKYTWDASALFENDQTWEEAYSQAEKMIGEFARYRGELGKSGKTLLACLRLNDEVGILVGKLSSYTGR